MILSSKRKLKGKILSNSKDFENSTYDMKYDFNFQFEISTYNSFNEFK